MKQNAYLVIPEYSIIVISRHQIYISMDVQKPRHH